MTLRNSVIRLGALLSLLVLLASYGTASGGAGLLGVSVGKMTSAVNAASATMSAAQYAHITDALLLINKEILASEERLTVGAQSHISTTQQSLQDVMTSVLRLSTVDERHQEEVQSLNLSLLDLVATTEHHASSLLTISSNVDALNLSLTREPLISLAQLQSLNQSIFEATSGNFTDIRDALTLTTTQLQIDLVDLNITIADRLLSLAEVVAEQNRSHTELLLGATHSGNEQVVTLSRIIHQNITEMSEHIQNLLAANLSSVNATFDTYSLAATERHANLTDQLSNLQIDLKTSNESLLGLISTVNTTSATNYDLVNGRLAELVVSDEDIKRTLLSSRLDLLEEIRSLNESFSGIVLKLNESLLYEIGQDVNESYFRVVSTMSEQREELMAAILRLNTSQSNSVDELRRHEIELDASLTALNLSLGAAVSQIREEVDRNSSEITSEFASAVAEVNSSLVSYKQELMDKFAMVALNITTVRIEQVSDMSALRLIIAALNQSLSGALDAALQRIQFDTRQQEDVLKNSLVSSISHLNSTLAENRLSVALELSGVEEQLKEIIGTAVERAAALTAFSARVDIMEPMLSSVEIAVTSTANRLAVLEDKASISLLSNEKMDSELNVLKLSILSPLRSDVESLNHTMSAQFAILGDRLSTADTMLSSVTAEASKMEHRIDALETKLAVVVEKTLPSLSERITVIETAIGEQSRRILALEAFADDVKRRTAGRDEVDSLRTMIFELQSSVVAHSAKVLEMVGNIKN